MIAFERCSRRASKPTSSFSLSNKLANVNWRCSFGCLAVSGNQLDFVALTAVRLCRFTCSSASVQLACLRVICWQPVRAAIFGERLSECVVVAVHVRQLKTSERNKVIRWPARNKWPGERLIRMRQRTVAVYWRPILNTLSLSG